MKNIPIGEVLKQYGYITEAQLSEALTFQKEHSNKRLGAILIELGFVTERQMLEALALRMDLKMVDLGTYPVNTEAVAKIPKPLALKYGLIAVELHGNRLSIVMSDPLNFYAVEDIRQITQMSLEIMVDVAQNIDRAIEYYYPEIEAKVTAQWASSKADALPSETLELTEDSEGDEAPVVQVLNRLLIRGHSINASDIHIEPFEEHVSVRMRMDGVITDYVTLAKSLHLSLIARVKILSNLDIAERRLPQDGHFRVTIEGVEINARVSIIPTIYGEKAVIRFLFARAIVDDAERFGFSVGDYEKFERMLTSPHGIIYITGPTGSGKTTTLYMVLERLANKLVNISTIEDPVERNIARVNQVQVNNVAGLTFERGLRALLRQDPDVIMVGETRDSETATISVRAAITGHLVLSTLHTNDAISSIVRLRDMGIPAYLVANSLVGLVAQRLMRKVCPHCGQTYAASLAEQQALGQDGPVELKRGPGCHLCSYTGYKGRMAVHEVVVIDKTIRRMITEDAPMDDIVAYVSQNQSFTSLRDSAREAALKGITSMEEYYKVAYYAD
ncbi:GspE/PulE family protein [Gehongia tenuis]|uniref:Flp pilus assembly complex ATPase component TadA n=1 Tax=Gehongia tenuis TaxID=2763655 RepID=A0A926HPC2_9FIRM|nr:type II/IV secretion system protein [Gehongia tenuis]MBC8531063.1 Flp pilus assembly complex ATPase component TadA [Gehongia tenuis]